MPDSKNRKIYDWKTRKYVEPEQLERKKPTISEVAKAIQEEDLLLGAKHNDSVAETTDHIEPVKDKKKTHIKETYKSLTALRQSAQTKDITQLSDEEIDSALRQSMALKQVKEIGLRTYQLVCLFPPQCRNRAPKDLMERPDLITLLEDFREKIERCLKIICKEEYALSNDFNNKGLRIAFKSEQDCHDFIYIHKNFFTQLSGKMYIRDTDTNHTEEYEITETKKGYLII